MGKKMKFPFIFNINNTYSSSPSRSASWPWPAYCHQPKTLSFRNGSAGGDPMYKTINSAYNLDDTTPAGESWFTNSSESASFSTASDDESAGVVGGESSMETVIRGVRSERLFFKPGETSRSILEAKDPFKESVVLLSMESKDPYVDFKESMEEMVEAHGLADWDGLEELLSCYLKVNGRSNHGFIISAFVDLLVGLAFANFSNNSSNCTNTISSPSSPLSFYTSSSSYSSSSDYSSSTPCCVSSLETGEEIYVTPN